MDTDVLVAFIAALSALLVACASFVDSTRTRRANRKLAEDQRLQEERLAVLNAKLAQEAQLEEREHTARAELDRAREPLLSAAIDLAGRLDNIRGRGLLTYLSSGDYRASIVRLSTLYRFARYWCIVESLYDQVVLVQLRADQATRPVAACLRQIGQTFASDKYGRGFMLWREEQRAVAELMRVDGVAGTCLGFATFVEQYEPRFSRWLGALSADLESPSAEESQRLLDAQRQLAQLVGQLDQEGMYREQWERLLDAAPVQP